MFGSALKATISVPFRNGCWSVEHTKARVAIAESVIYREKVWFRRSPIWFKGLCEGSNMMEFGNVGRERWQQEANNLDEANIDKGQAGP